MDYIVLIAIIVGLIILWVAFEATGWAIIALFVYACARLAAWIETPFIGRDAAMQRLNERHRHNATWCELYLAKPNDDDAAENTPSKPSSIIPLAILGLLVAVIAGTMYATFAIRSHLTKKRTVETTAQVESLADRYHAELIDESTPRPQSMALADVDGWGKPIDLNVSRWMLDTTITVRSNGPDGKHRTRDDITATRTHSTTAKDASQNLLDRGVDAARERASNLFQRNDEEDGPNQDAD